MSDGLTLTFVEPDGNVRTLEGIAAGGTLMEAGRDNDVKGILADCGGACACATCHVYVEGDWFDVVGAPDDIEAEMLDMVSDTARPNSRLSCQIRLRAELDGLRVEVAPSF